MKVSYNWLSQYIPLDTGPDALADILTGLGLEVASVEPWSSVPGGLEGVVIGEVLECAKHPNADRLSLTKVAVGNGTILPIVCGAPNVAKGQKVVVAPPGTTIHPTGGEPFTIDARKVRGEMSEGMICAADELGLGTDHSGILVLPPEVETGAAAADYFKVEKDYIFDIELTPNRSDATSHLGVAQDLAAYLSMESGVNIKPEWPSVDNFRVDNRTFPVGIEVKNQEACPRYAGVTIHNITVKASPEWLQRRLRAIGIRPINNIVDVTNFVLHEMGQPLHAFDAEKIGGKKILVQTLPEGSSFVTLDGQERKLNAEDLMICDGHSNGLCIAGVFGGISSGVTEKTRTVFLESAHFNPKWVRRTSMRHNLRTEAAKCFEKTTDPAICVTALKRAALLILETAGGEIASEIVDVYPEPIMPAEVILRQKEVKRILGIEIENTELERLLDALDFGILNKKEEEGKYLLSIPTNKADVQREVDVLEELLRIHGINKVPLKDKMSTTFSLAERPSLYHFRRMLGNFLSSLGFREMMGLSMVDGRYYEQLENGEKGTGTVRILNTSNESLDLLRPDMLGTALVSMKYNLSRQQNVLRFFEFGHSYRKAATGYTEKEHLILCLSENQQEPHWLDRKEGVEGYFILKGYVDAVLNRCGLDAETDGELPEEFGEGLTLVLDGMRLVSFGQVSDKWLDAFDIRSKVYFADFDLAGLYTLYKQVSITAKEISRFPAIRRDLALLLPEEVSFSALKEMALNTVGPVLKELSLFDVYRNEDQLGQGQKSYALHLVFEDRQKTLRDVEVDTAIGKLLRSYASQFSARLR